MFFRISRLYSPYQGSLIYTPDMALNSYLIVSTLTLPYVNPKRNLKPLENMTNVLKRVGSPGLKVLNPYTIISTAIRPYINPKGTPNPIRGVP